MDIPSLIFLRGLGPMGSILTILVSESVHCSGMTWLGRCTALFLSNACLRQYICAFVNKQIQMYLCTETHTNS